MIPISYILNFMMYMIESIGNAEDKEVCIANWNNHLRKLAKSTGVKLDD